MKKSVNRKETSKRNPKDDKPKIVYTKSFKVARSDTLLEFLLNKMDLSRNSTKSLLGSKKILVNGAVVTQFDYPLAKDDEVKIAKNPVSTLPNRRSKAQNIQNKPNPIKECVIYEDDVFIAINKPNGLLSVQSDNDTESAYKYVEELLKARDPKLRPYVLHRIDKETSGVLVFAKDIKIHSMLKMHWNDDIKMREYYAVINGKMDEKNGIIKTYLKENENNMVYVAKSGKLAVTNYETVKSNGQYSLLKVEIDTGRKNQIRVHLSHMGHPIVGDDKYGDGVSPIMRLGLHASRLSFIHPLKKELITLSAPVPKEFNNLFK